MLLVALLLIASAAALNMAWPLEPSARAALPYLALPIVHWHAFRMPQALPAPVVLVAGLVADLMADTPFGFWALIYLSVLASGRSLGQLLGRGGGGLWQSLLAVPVYAIVAAAVALTTTYLYTLAPPPVTPALAGIGLGAALELALCIIARSILPRPPAVATRSEA